VQGWLRRELLGLARRSDLSTGHTAPPRASLLFMSLGAFLVSALGEAGHMPLLLGDMSLKVAKMVRAVFPLPRRTISKQASVKGK